MVKKISITLLFFILFLQVNGKNLRFHHITLEDGISNSHIFCITQDSKGFIWIGTQDGLNRYDGYTFKHYFSKPNDPTSINDNTVFSLFAESDTVIWVGTFMGLNKFNPTTGKFKTVTLGIYGTPKSVSPIKHILKDDEGYLWLATTGQGIVRYNPSSGDYKEFPAGRSRLRPELNRYYVLWQAPENKLWAGTDGAGVIILDQKTGSFTELKEPGNAQALHGNENVFFIYHESDKFVWIGTRERGLFRYNLETNEFRNFTHNPLISTTIGGNEVYAVLKDSYGNLWFGVNDGGLNLYHPETGEFERIVHEERNRYGLLNNKIRYLFEDNHQNIWILSFQKGFNIMHPHYSFFNYYDVSDNSLYKYESTTVLSILMDNKKNLWVGTDGGGLKYINRITNQVKTYLPDKNVSTKNSLPDKVVLSIMQDGEGNLWLGTFMGGLVKFNPGTNSWKVFQPNANHPGSISSIYITDILEDRKGDIWVATNGGGVNLLKKNATKFICFNEHSQDIGAAIVNDWVNCLYEDSKGRIWIGTYLGFTILDLDHNFVRHYQRSALNSDEISHNTIYSILEDSKGRMWIGTQNGLNLFNESDNTFKIFTIDDGLPNNVINGIVEDTQGNLWISTNKGISRFNFEHLSFKNFYVEDGLQSNEFFRGSFYKGFNNEVFFGGINGLNSFFPSDLENNSDFPKVIITDLKIFNEDIPVGYKVNGKVILPKSISYLDTLILPYTQKSFSFEFSSLNFTSPEKIEYKYKMDGFDNGWKTVNSSYRFVTYTNLDPGQYQFLMKASNIDNQWGDNYSKLTVIIKPPVWNTLLAKIIYTLLIAFLLFITIRIITGRINEKTKYRMDILHREKADAINQAKLRFFTNISHEFRTPLTLILSPIEKIIKDKNLDEKSRSRLDIVIKNARRLLRLVNQLLDLRKIDGEKMQLKVERGDIIKFIKSLVYSFEEYALQKKISLVFECPLHEFQLWFDPDKTDKIFFNLLSNAFKFTPERGQIVVKVSRVIVENDDTKNRYLQIEINDTGKGIPRDHLDKIFDRFFQVDENKNTIQGSGLGLALTRSFVDIHHGIIKVDSIPGEGTSFKVLLPEDDSVFNQEEKIESNLPMTNQYIHPTPYVDNEQQEKKGRDIKSFAETILIAEDNYDLSNYLCEELSDEYNVITVNNGREGIKVTLDEMPELVISDIMMPEINGFDLCKTIKTNILTSHIPVILLTAKTDNEQKIAGFSHGADAYITKPFDIDFLKAQVKQIIENRKKLKEKYSNYLFSPDSLESFPSINDKFIDKVTNMIMKNMGEQSLNVEHLSQELGMSRGHLHRKIKSAVGLGPNEYIRMIRLKEAAKLFMKKDYNISEISFMVGFNNPAYFTKCFKDYYNLSPSEFISRNTRKL